MGSLRRPSIAPGFGWIAALALLVIVALVVALVVARASPTRSGPVVVRSKEAADLSAPLLYGTHDPRTDTHVAQGAGTPGGEAHATSASQETLIQGRAVDEGDEPIPGWHMDVVARHANGASRRYEIRADERGVVRRRIERADRVRLYAKHHGYETVFRECFAAANETCDIGTLVLPRGSTLHGVVEFSRSLTTRAGNHDGRFSLLARETPSRGRVWDRYHRAMTGPDGAFEFRGLHADRTYVVYFDVERDIVHPHAAAALTTDPALPDEPVHIDARGLAAIEVHWASDALFAFTLQWHRQRETPMPRSGSYMETEFLTSRTWSWLVLPSEAYVLGADMFGAGPPMLQSVRAGAPGTVRRIEAVPPHGGVTLVPRTSDGGRPRTLRVWGSHVLGKDRASESGPDGLRTRTLLHPQPTGGRFDVWPLAVGRHELRIVADSEREGAPGYVPAEVVVTVSRGQPTEQTLELARGGDIEFTVVSPREYAPGRVRLRARGSPNWQDVRLISRYPSRPRPEAESRNRRTFRAGDPHVTEPLPHGDYELAWQQEGSPDQVHPIIVRSGETEKVRIVADR